jgi:hypothetical protein
MRSVAFIGFLPRASLDELAGWILYAALELVPVADRRAMFTNL